MRRKQIYRNSARLLTRSRLFQAVLTRPRPFADTGMSMLIGRISGGRSVGRSAFAEQSAISLAARSSVAFGVKLTCADWQGRQFRSRMTRCGHSERLYFVGVEKVAALCGGLRLGQQVFDWIASLLSVSPSRSKVVAKGAQGMDTTHLVVVGGGTAGWLAALVCQDHARRAGLNLTISVVEFEHDSDHRCRRGHDRGLPCPVPAPWLRRTGVPAGDRGDDQVRNPPPRLAPRRRHL